MKYNIENSRKRKKTHWTNRTYVLVLVIVLFFLSARAAYHIYQSKKQSEEAAISKARELANMQEREIYLKQELQKLSTTAGREAEMRDKFGVGSEGENLAVIIESKATTTSDNSPGFWQSIKTFFSGLFK